MVSLASRLPSFGFGRFVPAEAKGDGKTLCPRCGEKLVRHIHADSSVFGTLGVYRIELKCEPCGWRKQRRVGM